jgi:hypothetical protein
MKIINLIDKNIFLRKCYSCNFNCLCFRIVSNINHFNVYLHIDSMIVLNYNYKYTCNFLAELTNKLKKKYVKL